MSVLSIVKSIGDGSFKTRLKSKILRYLGIEDYGEEIKTLQYFLNMYCTPSSLPPTKDEDLRALQICDSHFLYLFDAICRKYSLTYWLDWGTLLGAVRHNGFIPWDDDMDVAMTREDYDKLFEVAKDDFDRLGIEVRPQASWKGLGYRHDDTGVWVDVFPKDILVKDSESFICDRNCCPTPDGYVIAGREIFPLSTHTFEGYEFPVPANSDAVLKMYYGQNYMQFPTTGVELHGEGRIPLKLWAKQSGTDMEKIGETLKRRREEFMQK